MYIFPFFQCYASWSQVQLKQDNRLKGVIYGGELFSLHPEMLEKAK